MFELTPFFYSTLGNDFYRDFYAKRPDTFGGAVAFRTDIRDTGDNFLIETELPGFGKEDVDVSLSDDVMTVTAKRKFDKEAKDTMVHRERRFGFYKRSYDVSEIDTDNITAALENGILTLTLPKKKAPEKEVRRIALQ